MNNNILPNGIATAQFIEDANHMDNDSLMNKYDVSARTIRRWRQRIRENDEDIITTSFPESSSPQYTDYLKLNYDRLCVIGDIEVPDQDPVVLNMAARLSEKLGINHVLINGDFVALDVFSAWPVENRQRVSLEDDLEMAEDIIKVFLNTFDTVDYIIGNHERRLARQLRGQSSVGYFCKKTLGVQYSNYTYCELINGGKEILICHPEDFSRIPLAVPLKIAAINHTNVLCGHSHRLCQGYDPSGKYFVAEGGHSRDPSRTMYSSMKMTSYPKWSSGFTILLDGNLFLIDKNNYSFWINNVKL